MPIERSQLPEFLFAFDTEFRKAGFEVFLVGGVLRDLLLTGRFAEESGDFDFATAARPEQVQRLFRKVIPTGIEHGTVTVLFRERVFEVTTYRADGVYSDGRHPDSISFSDTIEEDLARRDFTINAMALDLASLRLVDPFGGMRDLEARLVRAVGDPTARFREDGLRVLRACRFAGKLDFHIEEATFAAIPDALAVFRQVAVERVRDELVKILQSDRPSLAFEAMRKTGLLAEILPELLEGYQIEQNEYHRYDIYYHNLYACDAAPSTHPLIRFAALFHDIGKARAAANARRNGHGGADEADPVFYNHELIGARMADRIMRRLKFSNQDREHAIHLIRHHMFHYTDEWTDGAVRRLMRNVGVENLDDLFMLRMADREGNGKKRGPSQSLERLRRRIAKVIEAENAITVRDLAVNGHDIMNEFAIPPSRLIGEILENLLEVILDEPEKNERATLLALARQYLADRDANAR